MRNLAFVAAALLIGCGQPRVRGPQPVGVEGHMAAADQHEQAANAYDEATIVAEANTPPNWDCGDTDLLDQLNRSIDPVVNWQPCWDLTAEYFHHTRTMANNERHAARVEREAAARLIQAERDACHGLRQRELEHPVFEHTKEITEVVPHRESGKIRGVRIEFKPVPGLTAEWMRRAIACHQARYAALGNPTEYSPNDPTLLPGVHVSVAQQGGHVEVLVITDTEVDGKIAYERGKALAPPQTAIR